MKLDDIDIANPDAYLAGVPHAQFALLRREERFVLPQRVVDDADDDLVEDVRGPGDDVEVAEGDRVIGPRTDDGSVALAHSSSPA